MVKRFSGPTVIETDDDGNNPVAIFTGPDKREIRSNDADYAAAVVGAAGIPIAQVDLAATTGTAETLYAVSDGDNRGAKIVWAVPEGASVATWCWWLWPQSAFEI